MIVGFNKSKSKIYKNADPASSLFYVYILHCSWIVILLIPLQLYLNKGSKILYINKRQLITRLRRLWSGKDQQDIICNLHHKGLLFICRQRKINRKHLEPCTKTLIFMFAWMKWALKLIGSKQIQS